MKIAINGVGIAGPTLAYWLRRFGHEPVLFERAPSARLDRMEHADDLYFDRVSQIHLGRWASGRVALVGDAAACASLLAGEGTGLAMVEAYVLAGELHQAAGDIASASAAYEARLRAFVTAKQKAALSLRQFFAPRTALAHWMRDLAVNALSLPVVGRHILARSLRDDLVLPDYGA